VNQLARTRFSGPIRSSNGFEVGTGATNTSVIDGSGNIVGTVVYTKITVAAATLPTVAAGKFQLFMTSTRGIVARTSTGNIKLST